MKKLNRSVYAIVGIIVLLMIGLVYAWSIMAKSIGASRPEWSAAQLSLVFTITMICFCAGSLFAGIFAEKFKPRTYVLSAGILYLAGFWIASFAGETTALLNLGFGVLGGLGAGFAYNAVMSTLSQWFPDKQGFISGLMLMGFGLSSFLIGKIFAQAAPADGTDTWQVVFRIFGSVIFGILFVLCWFFVRPENENFAAMEMSKKENLCPPAAEMKTKEMMRTSTFWCYYIWSVFIGAAGLIMISQASGIASQVGATVSNGTIATVVGMISIFNGIGRVLFGAVYDKKGYRFTMLTTMALFAASALILILAIISGKFLWIIVGYVIGGLGNGGVTPTNSALVSDFFGRKNYPVNFPVVNTNLLFASFASTIAGQVYDMTGSYMTDIILMLGVLVVSFLAFFGVRRPKGCEENFSTKQI